MAAKLLEIEVFKASLEGQMFVSLHYWALISCDKTKFMSSHEFDCR
jgi:hypothetical protein